MSAVSLGRWRLRAPALVPGTAHAFPQLPHMSGRPPQLPLHVPPPELPLDRAEPDAALGPHWTPWSQTARGARTARPRAA
eukprot:scaffold29968_cov112-Isochrysis_galbana.AAC.4